jgi:hypothetical protein
MLPIIFSPALYAVNMMMTSGTQQVDSTRFRIRETANDCVTDFSRRQDRLFAVGFSFGDAKFS